MERSQQISQEEEKKVDKFDAGAAPAENEPRAAVDDIVSSLVGNKCSAPFRSNREDSHHSFHNAIIFSGQ